MAEGELNSLNTVIKITNANYADSVTGSVKVIEAFRVGNIVFVYGYATGITNPKTGGVIFKNLPPCNSTIARFPVQLQDGLSGVIYWSNDQWNIASLLGKTSINFGFCYTTE